ncbi:lysine transporter LysE [Kiloniella spongiae]|uniref:Lysine transporter LysE n=1 Tax=Kiloniella spongiae TaxID=1489064 RepID=A0A0H2MI14_9PROT|nr:LysE family translocator [Kiloniella spongiae]KLN61836.1 lysine transporter LysE [Kiloniella spongiae]
MDSIAIYLPGILLAYAAFLISIASPGPNVLAVIGTSMEVGRKSGMALALGVSLGSFCWAMLTVLGLSALLSTYAIALTIIKVGGGLYLLWLAYKSFKAARQKTDLVTKTLAGGDRSPVGYFLRGLAIQMTNPKAVLAWIAIISIGLTEGAPVWVGVTIVAGTSLLSVIIHLTYAVSFSTPVMVHLYAKARRSIQFALGSFFAFAGIKLLSSRL